MYIIWQKRKHQPWFQLFPKVSTNIDDLLILRRLLVNTYRLSMELNHVKNLNCIVSVFLTKELNDSITLMKIVTLSLGTYTLLSEDYSYEPKRPTYQHDLGVHSSFLVPLSGVFALAPTPRAIRVVPTCP